MSRPALVAIWVLATALTTVVAWQIVAAAGEQVSPGPLTPVASLDQQHQLDLSHLNVDNHLFDHAHDHTGTHHHLDERIEQFHQPDHRNHGSGLAGQVDPNVRGDCGGQLPPR